MHLFRASDVSRLATADPIRGGHGSLPYCNHGPGRAILENIRMTVAHAVAYITPAARHPEIRCSEGF